MISQEILQQTLLHLSLTNRQLSFLGFKDPVGKTLKWNGEPFTIIGIVNDIMQESPFYPVRPTLYHIGKYENMYNLILRLNPTTKCKAIVKQY